MSYTLLLRAAEFSAKKHVSQRRKGKDLQPYINHPIRVAFLLTEIGGVDNPQILAAALLHDTIEDTVTTSQELQELFGEVIKDIVLEVSDDKSLPKPDRKRLQIEHASKKSSEAALVSIADKIANLEDIATNPPAHWDHKRCCEYLEWAEKVVSKLPVTNSNLLERFATTLKDGWKRLMDGALQM
jgi:GTP diphosphokinase / guanosine-3',5'-bis(diphosphate) 3'-diphosphatase